MHIQHDMKCYHNYFIVQYFVAREKGRYSLHRLAMHTFSVICDINIKKEESIDMILIYELCYRIYMS